MSQYKRYLLSTCSLSVLMSLCVASSSFAASSVQVNPKALDALKQTQPQEKTPSSSYYGFAPDGSLGTPPRLLEDQTVQPKETPSSSGVTRSPSQHPSRHSAEAPSSGREIPKENKTLSDIEATAIVHQLEGEGANVENRLYPAQAAAAAAGIPPEPAAPQAPSELLPVPGAQPEPEESSSWLSWFSWLPFVGDDDEPEVPAASAVPAAPGAGTPAAPGQPALDINAQPPVVATGTPAPVPDESAQPSAPTAAPAAAVPATSEISKPATTHQPSVADFAPDANAAKSPDEPQKTAEAPADATAKPDDATPTPTPPAPEASTTDTKDEGMLDWVPFVGDDEVDTKTEAPVSTPPQTDQGDAKDKKEPTVSEVDPSSKSSADAAPTPPANVSDSKPVDPPAAPGSDAASTDELFDWIPFMGEDEKETKEGAKPTEAEGEGAIAAKPTEAQKASLTDSTEEVTDKDSGGLFDWWPFGNSGETTDTSETSDVEAPAASPPSTPPAEDSSAPKPVAKPSSLMQTLREWFSWLPFVDVPDEDAKEDERGRLNSLHMDVAYGVNETGEGMHNGQLAALASSGHHDSDDDAEEDHHHSRRDGQGIKVADGHGGEDDEDHHHSQLDAFSEVKISGVAPAPSKFAQRLSQFKTAARGLMGTREKEEVAVSKEAAKKMTALDGIFVVSDTASIVGDETNLRRAEEEHAINGFIDAAPLVDVQSDALTSIPASKEESTGFFASLRRSFFKKKAAPPAPTLQLEVMPVPHAIAPIAEIASANGERIAMFSFPEGHSQLQEVDKALLEKQLDGLKGQTKLRIIGYTNDADAAHTRKLALQRAISVRSFLVDHQVSGEGIMVQLLPDHTNEQAHHIEVYQEH